jgi:hypothetical protein
MTRVAALLLLLVTLAAAGAAPVPKHLMKEPAFYHPTEAGAKWVYQSHGIDDPVGHEVVEVVMSMIEPKGGEKGVRVAELGTVFRGKTHGSTYLAISPQGLTEGYMALGGNFVTRIEALRVADTPGASWEATIGQGPNAYKMKQTHRGEETIDVPAGRFRALRVDTTFVYKGAPERVWKRWYAPGIGTVKLEADGGRKVLKEFTPGKR